MMRWLYKLLLRFRSLFRKNRVEQDLSDELRFHLEKLTEEYAAKGMTPEEARYAALRELGGVEQIKEECRDTRRVDYIETFLQDVRYGLRQLRRSPGFTAVAVLTLALGIGANTAIFSILNSFLLRELPVPEPERVVSFSSTSFSYPDYVDFRDQNKAFEGLCAYLELPAMANLGSSRPPERVMGQLVTGNFFSVLGIKPMLGRGFLPAEDQLANPTAVVMLSNDLWRRLGANPGVIGEAVRLDSRSYTVVGVTPPAFRGVFFGLSPDFWAPMAMLPQLAPAEADAHPFANRNERAFAVVGRIKHGVTRSQALAETNLINDRIRKAAGERERRPVSFENPGGLPGDLGQFAFGLTAILMIVAGLVLLVACANLANLLLARGTARRKEISIRLAIGGGRARLVRQLMTENLLLSIPGAAIGSLLSFMPPGQFPGWDSRCRSRSAWILSLMPECLHSQGFWLS